MAASPVTVARPLAVQQIRQRVPLQLRALETRSPCSVSPATGRAPQCQRRRQLVRTPARVAPYRRGEHRSTRPMSLQPRARRRAHQPRRSRRPREPALRLLRRRQETLFPSLVLLRSTGHHQQQRLSSPRPSWRWFSSRRWSSLRSSLLRSSLLQSSSRRSSLRSSLLPSSSRRSSFLAPAVVRRGSIRHARHAVATCRHRPPRGRSAGLWQLHPVRRIAPTSRHSSCRVPLPVRSV